MTTGRAWLAPGALSFVIALLVPQVAEAQARAALTGRVIESETAEPVQGALVEIEGTELRTLSDSIGRYRLSRVPPGPQVLVVENLGYATARVPITVPTQGVMSVDVELATSALQVEGLTVTADATSRARGELGTASVVEQEAIDVQTATSLRGILELTPGVEIRPPGLDQVEQISLRAAPTSSFTTLGARGASPSELASFGTLVILNGVPVSNNANLQSTGPRGELSVPSSAGGGIDLRRIPGSTLERVEVIRGVPSARFGDLTQGAIVVDTRAGAFEPRLDAIFDPFTGGGSFVGGWGMQRDALSATFDVTRTLTDPGFRDNEAVRLTGQAAHRARTGRLPGAGGLDPTPRLTLDTRLDLFQLLEDNPEDTLVAPGSASFSRDRGGRLLERARLNLDAASRIELTAALDYTGQSSFVESLRSRVAQPFTDRVTEGRSEGRFIGGTYQSRVDVEGDVWQLFARLEADLSRQWLGLDHRIRVGGVMRREWNSGEGFQFDIEFPPQVTFNGVQGFDRPHPYEAVDPLVTSALYADDRILGNLAGWPWEAQAGLRLDLLHEGSHWGSGVRDAELQPRLNLQIAPAPWLRLRGAAGLTSKSPTLGQLAPAPQYFDVVNVNWYTADPAERLAVLTTFIRDPTNPDLGFSRGSKMEAGIELGSPAQDLSVSLTAFRDRTTGGVGIRERPDVIFRDRFALTDSTSGNGVPPDIVEPPKATDSIPILADVPANILTLESRGLELTAFLPEIPRVRTRLEVQGALIDTEFFKEGLDFGTRFGEFQLDERVPRAPYWEGVRQTGLRGLMTYRLVHHQPEIGLVITGTVQHFVKEEVQNVAETDTLAWEGYITRGGNLVPVPEDQRTRPEFADLRQARSGLVTRPNEIAPDWILSLRASLDLPFDGRLSLWAFNALDRPGNRGDQDQSLRTNRPLRFGLEGTFRLGWLMGSTRGR